MIPNPGLRALTAIAAGVLACRVLLQVLFLSGGAETIGLTIITVLAAVVAVVVFRGLSKPRASIGHRRKHEAADA